MEKLNELKAMSKKQFVDYINENCCFYDEENEKILCTLDLTEFYIQLSAEQEMTDEILDQLIIEQKDSILEQLKNNGYGEED